MNLTRVLCLGFGLVAALVIVPLSGAADADAFTPILIKGHLAHPARVLAKVRPVAQPNAQASTLAALGLRTVSGFAHVPGLVVLDVPSSAQAMAASSTSVSDAEIQAALLANRLEALRASGLFDYVEPDFLVRVSGEPSDARFADGSLWGLRNNGQNQGVAGVDIDAVHAWDLTTGSSNVIVAVIDSGIRYTHEDLAANMWRNPGEIAGNGKDDDHNGYIDDTFGINAATGSGNPDDDAGHGTHVAGTIGAAANNGHPMVGVAWNVRLMACKFLSAEGGGQTSDAIACIDYAVAHGARILNCSWGGGPYSNALRDAFAAARAAGVLVVAAAGNEGNDNDRLPHYPASYDLDNIIAVTAIDRQGYRADFSNHGATSVDLAAPGVEIYSTLNFSNSAYGYAEGTSMAAPHVSGVAALLWSRDPSLSLKDARDRLLTSVTPLPGLDGLVASGGCVDAHGALTAVPDGLIEATLLAPAGAALFRGRTVAVVVRVTDAAAITNATVSGIIEEVPPITLRDDGVAPDLVAQDANYTGAFVVPSGYFGSRISLAVSVEAPAKTGTSTARFYDVYSPPENDDFENRTVISGVQTSVPGWNFGASKQSGEPVHAGNVGGTSLWWSWTAPANTTVTITTEGTEFDSSLAVYVGSGLSSLSLVAENDDAPNAGPRPYSRVDFAANAGTSYQIAVDGFNGASGAIALHLSTTITADNDRFADATALEGATGSVVADLYNSTREPGEPDHGTTDPAGSLWWKWTAPGSGIVRFSTTAHLLAVYTGDVVSALTPVLARNEGGVNFAAVAGTTYRIAVGGGYGFQNVLSPFTVSFELSPEATNDDFADRLTLTGVNGNITVDNRSATREPGEPVVGIGATVWWTWTAPSSGSAVLSLDRDFLDFALYVYTGSSLAGLTEVANNATSFYSPRRSRAVFTAEAGTTYQVLVDSGRAGTADNVQLDFELSAGPPNDDWANAAVLTGASASGTEDNSLASRETGEPVPTAYGTRGTLWWAWTAPFSGSVNASTSLNYYLAVYAGDSLAGLQRVDTAISPIVTNTRFPAVAGTTYYFWTDGVFGAVGSVTVTVELLQSADNDQFSAPTEIAGADVTAPATLKNTTFEAFDPYFGWNVVSSAGGSAWWTWTAPASGRTVVYTVGTNASIVVGVAVPELRDFVRLRGILNEEYADGAFAFNAIGGTRYLIAVADRNPAAAEPFVLRVLQAAAPARDRFVERERLEGRSILVQASNNGAYIDPYEPQHAFEPPHASLWWTWTAPVTGWVGLDATESSIQTNVQVYTGDEVDRLTHVAGNGGEPEVRFGPVAFTAIAGTTYQIVVDGHENATGEIVLTLSQHDSPANNDFAGRLPLVGAPVSLTAGDLGATRETEEPDHAEFNALKSTVWWTWTAPATGTATVAFDETSRGFGCAVYVGTALTDLRPVESSDSTDGGERVTFHAEEGTEYAIAVGVRNRAAGEFTLTITLAEPPTNDMFAGRIPLASSPLTVAGSCANASREFDEPENPAGWPTVWWKWTAPSDGRATIQIADGVSGRNYGAVFTGNAVEELVEVAASLQSGAKNHLFWKSRAGETYQIMIAASSGSEWEEFTLDFAVVEAPPNDDFANRLPLTGIGPMAQGTNLGASGEPGEPSVSNYPEEVSVWWTWIAPLNVEMVLSTHGSDFDTCLTIYKGLAVDALTRIVTNNDARAGIKTSRVVFDAVAGTAYHIGVTGTWGAMGNIHLSGSPGEPPLAGAVGQATQEAVAGTPLTLLANATGEGPFEYRWLRNGVIIPGETDSILVLASAQLFDSGVYSVRVRNEFGESESPVADLDVAEPGPSGARLTNLSTRALALTGDNVLIPGFVVEGPGNKQLLIRAVGPTLGDFGVPGTLPDPRLVLKRWNPALPPSGGYEDVETNNDWGTNPNAAAIITKSVELSAFPLAAGSADAALLVDLAPGQYSVVAGDAGTATGIAIVELYDAASAGSTSRLINISNRGYVGVGDNIMIPGFVVSNEGPKTLLIRVVGPTLGGAPYNVPGVLADPTLSIYRHDFINNSDDLILTNDDWSTGPGAQRTRDVAAQVFAFPLPEGSKDAAFVVTLNPGVYTVHARGKDDSEGVALVEVYAVSP